MATSTDTASTLAGAPRKGPPWRRTLVWAGVLSVALAVLTALVASRAGVPRLDRTILSAVKPHNEWARRQRDADHLVELLRPTHLLIGLACVAVAIAAWRRSLLPLVLAAGCEAAIGLGVLGLKSAVAVRDPHHDLISGGSYPSGHTAQILVGFGVIALLMRGRLAAWLWALTALVTIAMAAALIVDGAHWASDVLGGALLGGIVLLLARIARYSPRLGALLIRSRTRKKRGHDGHVYLSPCEERSNHDPDAERSSRGRVRSL
jgi:membrane-associated phospholipid phosphatase